MAANSGSVAVLVPMKPLSDAKSRLSVAVGSGVRHAAVAHMLDTVVRASTEALGPGTCRVIGGDSAVRHIAEAAGGMWQADRGKDLNTSLWLAMQTAYNDGYRATLFLPADLPMASAGSIRTVVAASNGLAHPAGVRAAQDGGTNALLVPSACVFAPRLGLNSFALHRETAAGQGTPMVEVDAPDLAFDVDSADDLEWARRHVAGFTEALAQWETRLADIFSRPGETHG